MTKTTEGGKTDVADVGRLDWDHVRRVWFLRDLMMTKVLVVEERIERFVGQVLSYIILVPHN
jgi:hypothetical protein